MHSRVQSSLGPLAAAGNAGDGSPTCEDEDVDKIAAAMRAEERQHRYAAARPPAALRSTP
jgi:hypothetical protein